MFWKRFYFVVILLLCNCFLLCCNGFCDRVKKFFGYEQKTTTGFDFEQVVDLDNNNILPGDNNTDNCGNTGPNDSGNLYDKFKNIDFSKLELIFDQEVDLSNKRRIDFTTLFCSATDYRVGKTNIINVAKKHTNFDENEECTIGLVSFYFYSKITDNTLMRIQVLDSASASRFQLYIKNYYRNKNVIIFVYDITNVESFNNLGGYITEVQGNASEGCLFFLLGNKLDLVEQNQDARQVTTEEAKKLACDKKLIFLGECSAKNNTYMPVAGNTCYKKESLQNGKCLDGLTGIFKDILSNIVKQRF